MHISPRVVALVLILLLSGCSDPSIDASSEDAFYQSAGRMAQALPAEERDAFTDALMALVVAGVDFSAKPDEGGQLDLEAAMARLGGMSIDQVMAAADALRGSHGAGVHRDASRHDGPVDRPE